MADKDGEKLTIIGPETRVAGELRGDEDVVVRGRVEGRVNLGAVFTVEESAIVQADVEARVILISGVVVGNVNATEIIRLTEKARVVGDLAAPRVVIEAGAAFRGRLDMGDIAAGAAASVRTQRSRPAEGATKAAPPRMTAPSRVSPGAVAARPAAPAAPPRPPVAAPATAARAPAPPALPRPGAAAAGGIASGTGPSWAKKKLQRRR
jgi:cytoskeletal protein CcmA (bactofilin family)